MARIRQVAIATKDVDHLVKFYTAVFGFQVDDVDPLRPISEPMERRESTSGRKTERPSFVFTIPTTIPSIFRNTAGRSKGR
jgi:predicted enzyme related to lactoylglutathione lyase